MLDVSWEWCVSTPLHALVSLTVLVFVFGICK